MSRLLLVLVGLAALLIPGSVARGADTPPSRGQRIEHLRQHLEAQQARSDLLKEALCQNRTTLVCREIGDLDLSMKEYRGDLDDLATAAPNSRSRSTETEVRSDVHRLTARLDQIIQREIQLDAE